MIPRPRMPGWVAANTMPIAAASALATQTFRPGQTPSVSLRRRRRLLICGVGAGVLLRQREHAHELAGRERVQPARRWASLPNRSSTSATSELLTVRMTASVALARATASIASA